MDYSFLTRKSVLGDGPPPPPPKSSVPACTYADPQGKGYTPNTADGRVHTQSASSFSQTPLEQAQGQRELMCRDGVLGAIACNRPFLEFKSADFSASAGGWGTGVKTDGTAAGTEWDGISGGKSKKVAVRAGLCVQVIGAQKSAHKAEVRAAAGYVYGSVDAASQSGCIGGQFPPQLDAGLTIK